MPELPEVETVAAALRRELPECRIVKIKAHCQKLRRPLPLADLGALEGEVFTAVERRAKYLLLRLSDRSRVLMIHLGMTGTLRLDPAEAMAARHDHLEIFLDDFRVLRFRDPRKFGLIEVIRPEADGRINELAHLAPEPLSEEFSADFFYRLSRGRRTPVKNFIMDQRRVVGVGNIYASESLFRARIRPQTPVGDLSRQGCRKLVEKIKEVLSEAIAAGGTTIADFHGLDGSEGAFVRSLDVYGRTGQACINCQKPIKKAVLGGRSTFYCPSCQK